MLFISSLSTIDNITGTSLERTPKAKIIERKDIPSYEALTDDMARVQIQEFWNPKITAESNVKGTYVDARKEQEKILLRKIDRFIKPMSLTLKGEYIISSSLLC